MHREVHATSQVHKNRATAEKKESNPGSYPAPGHVPLDRASASSSIKRETGLELATHFPED